MMASRPSEILRQLEEGRTPDRELLARFVGERDQAAFAEIVRSYGPVVLGVCRRVTGHKHDAEDAFQAVFLTLVQKATSIRNPDALGCWLYSVAVQVARKARRSATRRRMREVVVSAMPEIHTQPSESILEPTPIIDEELAALPSWYREAIVLCDVLGISREEAARVLGVPEGTLSSRLANGRKKLAARLTKRGIALSTAAIATTFSTAQAVTVPAELHAKTCSLVADWSAGGVIPKPVAKLIDGGITMRKTLLLGMLMAAIAVSGVVYATHTPENPLPADPPKPPVVVAKTEAAEQPAPDPKPGDKTVAYTNKPKLQDSFDIGLHGITTVIWNMQGNRIAVTGKRYLGALPGDPLPGGALPNPPDQRREQAAVMVFPVFPVTAEAAMDSKSREDIWNISNKLRFVGCAPDGLNFLAEIREYQLVSGQHKLGFWGEVKALPKREMDLETPKAMQKILRSIDLDSTETQGYAFDGKTFRTVAIERNPATQKITKLTVQEVDTASGKFLKSLLSVTGHKFALSSDGKRLAIMDEKTVAVYDIDRAAKLCTYSMNWIVKQIPQAYFRDVGPASSGASPSLSFSPDGHRLIICAGVGSFGYIQGRQNQDWRCAMMSGNYGQTAVLNADTGEVLPALQDGECLETQTHSFSFTNNGRLLVLSGRQYVVDKEKRAADAERIVLTSPHSFLKVWDTQTGKLLKAWNRDPLAAFNPARPLLAVLEANGDDTRIGFWDFSAEMAEKK